MKTPPPLALTAALLSCLMTPSPAQQEVQVRAISFHHVDLILKMTVSGVRMNWFLELGGIALVWIAAIRELTDRRRSAK